MDKSSVVKWGGFSIPGYTYDVCGWARRSASEGGECIKRGEECGHLCVSVDRFSRKPLGDYAASRRIDEYEEDRVKAVVEECTRKIEECSKKIEEYDRKIKCISRAFVDFVVRGASHKINYYPSGINEIKKYY